MYQTDTPNKVEPSEITPTKQSLKDSIINTTPTLKTATLLINSRSLNSNDHLLSPLEVEFFPKHIPYKSPPWL